MGAYQPGSNAADTADQVADGDYGRDREHDRCGMGGIDNVVHHTILVVRMPVAFVGQ